MALRNQFDKISTEPTLEDVMFILQALLEEQRLTNHHLALITKSDMTAQEVQEEQEED